MNKATLIAIVLATLLGIAFILLAIRSPLSADTAGYEYAAKQLALGNGLAYDDVNNEIVGEFFSPFAFQIKHFDDSRLYLGFPPGFPLILALPGIITGQEAFIHYVVPILAAVGLLLTFILGRQVTENDWLALFAASLVGFMPIYWRFGTEAWSEIPAMVFVITGYIFYFSSGNKGLSEQSKVLKALLAGFTLVYGLFIRYSNITFLMSIALGELVSRPKEILKPSKKWVFYSVLLGGVLLILVFNHYYYGGIHLTSYSPENGWYAFPPFSVNYALGSSPVNGRSLIEAGRTLWQNFSVIVFFMPLGWWQLSRPYRLIFFLAVVSSLGLYTVYAFAPAGINSRFLIPIFPFLAILGAKGIYYFLQFLGSSRFRWVIIVILFTWLGWQLRSEVVQLQTRNQSLETAVTRLRSWLDPIEKDAVFMSYALNDHIAYYGDRSVLNYRRIPQYDSTLEKYRYDLFEPCLVYVVDTLLLATKPVYFHEDRSPTLYDAKEILEEHYRLTPVLDNPKLFRVTNDALTAAREPMQICTP